MGFKTLSGDDRAVFSEQIILYIVIPVLGIPMKWVTEIMASEQSSIVLFSTVAVAMGMPFHTSVAASKGAIEGFAKALAAEYTPKIRVNVIATSLADTALAGKFLSNEEKREKPALCHPLKRVGTTQDIA